MSSNGYSCSSRMHPTNSEADFAPNAIFEMVTLSEMEKEKERERKRRRRGGQGESRGNERDEKIKRRKGERMLFELLLPKRF